MPYARNLTGAAQTDTELVAAPGAGRQIVVEAVYATTDGVAGDQITFESSTTNLRWRIYLEANGSEYYTDEEGLFRCADNESLTYTTTGANDAFVSVEYQIARSTGA